MNNTFIDLWQLLEKYEVVVPVIQRDYAQGRKDKEYIRKTFLTELKEHVDNETPVTLDFVYGNVEGNRFYPLDGQQRLTTLWLIHWYISLKAGKLSDDKKILSKFYYETRTSSGDFCKALCNKMPNNVPGNIVDYIKSQTWFYSSWLQDPTISAMLRTIGGDNETTDDNIEAIFKDVHFDTYRNRLTNHSIVNFELMVISTEKLPISDDLYIKMNARGKGLTDFENFKADLVAWIQSPQNPDEILFAKKVDSSSINYKQYYPANIDNAWMDVFWNSAREKAKKAGLPFNGSIDDIYFSFINRYILNQMCLNENMSPAEFAPGKEDEINKGLKNGFDKLFGTGMRNSSADDSLVDYEGFDIYKPFITFDSLGKLDYILKVSADNQDIIDSALTISDVDEEGTNATGYSFIPRYILSSDGQKLASTSQKERVYFLAISLFIENCKMLVIDFDKDKFNRWMRVVRNLIENAGIDNVPGMVTCMRLIKKLAELLKQHGNDIYDTLKDYSDFFSNSQLENQLKEEKTKAEKIIEDNCWESKFEEAEKYAFFNGTIRFLYLNGETVVWDDFESKFSRAKELFDDNNTVPTNTITLLLKQFSGFEKIQDKYLFTSVGYHARHKCWKKDILCSEDVDVAKGVYSLLMNTAGPSLDADYHSFIRSGLIETIVSKDENYKYRYHWHHYWTIHKDYSQVEGVYVSLKRKEKCEVLKKLVDTRIIVLSDSKFNSYINGYYWGIKVTFEHDGSQYNWYDSYENGTRVDKIYKCNNGIESKNAMTWDDLNDPTSSITSFAFQF